MSASAVAREARYRGCLVGLAVGDALGAPVEFFTLEEIHGRYGPGGIADFDGWDAFAPGHYTDDTQMSIATAEGLLEARRRGAASDASAVGAAVHRAYLQWVRGQDDARERRRPGRTCVTALRSGGRGSIAHPLNHSKGCGGVMRVAPVGLAFPPERAFEIAADCAAITHGHPSGYLSAGFLAALLAWIVRGSPLPEAVQQGLAELARWDQHGETSDAVRAAVALAASAHAPAVAVAELGEGWVGEEALAIALCCALRFPDDWRAAVTAAVNHSGDSDSTGSICGAIAGALLGVDAIPEGWRERVENRERLDQLATELWDAFGS